jgi:hypothetical protein
MFFSPQIIFHSTGLYCTHISTDRHDFVLGTFNIQKQIHVLRYVHFADNYLYCMEGTMGSVCPQAEININKK